MGDTQKVFFETVAPTIGFILATAMFSTPAKAVLAARKAGELGDLNPMPYPVVRIHTVRV